MIKDINHLTLVWLCQVKMLIKEIFFNSNFACLALTMVTCKRNGIMYFLPKNMEANKISAKLQ